MRSARPAEQVFSPLDEELALVPGTFTPTFVESMVRVGTQIPFARAATGLLAHFTTVDVSEATVRRATERAGEAYVAVQTAEVVQLEHDLPPAPLGPRLQLLSVDGAMVPLLHKEWAEVKTLAVGTVGVPVWRNGEWEVPTGELSYFSRLAESESFARWATGETHRRGVETAGTVCAVNDGAEWEQKFVDLHRPDAVRILDWGHAAEYVVAAGQAVFGVGTPATTQWLEVQLDELRHGDPQTVLGKLRGLRDELAVQVGDESVVLKTVEGSLRYLEKRQDQIHYAVFSAAGYPIGSGAVESANKLVVEARLKGAGMHWAREHVDGMVALRDAACSDRWEEAWPQISEQWRRTAKERTAARRCAQRADQMARVAVSAPDEGGLEPVRAAPVPATPPEMPPAVATDGRRATCPQAGVARVTEELAVAPHRPAADHPWRRMRIGRARRMAPPLLPGAES